MGLALEPDEVAEIYARFVQLADKKKNIYEQDLIGIVQEHRVPAMAA